MPHPVQHHVYYTASHITSIALETSAGALFATDVAHNRVVHYNSSGHIAAVWSFSHEALFSPESVGYPLQVIDDGLTRLLYIADSASARIVQLDPVTGAYDLSAEVAVPSELFECGVVLAQERDSYVGVDLYVLDRYDATMAKVDMGYTPVTKWTAGPPPAAPSSSALAPYLAALTASPEWVYVLDAAADRVLRIVADDGDETYHVEPMLPVLFDLPSNVSGIQAVSWTCCSGECDQSDESLNDDGCLWLLYEPLGAAVAEQSVIVLAVNGSGVLNSWTVVAGVSEQRKQQQGSAVAGERQWRQTAQDTHVASPALRVDGNNSDSFRVYMAEADPSGHGHVVVVRNATGQLLRRYDAMPLVYDSSNATTHSFTSVLTDDASCTLWLTDTDNGGMLIRAARDGSILQHFATPACSPPPSLTSTTPPRRLWCCCPPT